MPERAAVLLPPLDGPNDVDRSMMQQDPASSRSRDQVISPTLPPMSCMSPVLQAHFLSLMSNSSGSSEETATNLPAHDRHSIAQETARLAMQEIAAMQRAVGELEQYVAVSREDIVYTHDTFYDSSELSDGDEDDGDGSDPVRGFVEPDVLGPMASGDKENNFDVTRQ